MNIGEAIKTLFYRKNEKTKNRLTTSYGEKIDPEHILNEYPRPQLKRNSFINLNGYWRYAISDSKDRPQKFDGIILVPYSPESILSGVEKQLKPSQYLFYERYIDFDEIPQQKKLILHFGAVDQKCSIWWNGRCVKNHIGGYLPFSIDVTDRVEKHNTLLVRVSDATDMSYHARGKQKLDSGGMFYTAQSGIWQTVWCEWVPDNYITDIKITPRLDEKKVVLKICTRYPVIKKITVAALGIKIKEVHSNEKTVVIDFDDCTDICEWTPEKPFLYNLYIEAGDDRVESYFAMRKYSIGPDKNGRSCLYLNNRPCYMHGVLDQGYYSDGLMTPASYDIIRDDIDAVKKLGFNMVRKHIKIEPLVYYYICDVKGMIVWQDMVNGGGRYDIFLFTILPTVIPAVRRFIDDRKYDVFGRSSYRGRREWITECRNTIRHLYNCPCIGMWILFNEGWGQFDSVKITSMVKKMDRTRLVDSASGWIDKGCSDVKSDHVYFEKIKVKKDKRPYVCSEYGGYAYYVKGHSYSDRIYGYKTCTSPWEFRMAYERLQKEIDNLKEKGLVADVYTQLSDVEDEVNGILTYDRKINKLDDYEEI